MLGVNSFELEGLGMSLSLLAGKSYEFHGVQDDCVGLINALENQYTGRGADTLNFPEDQLGAIYHYITKLGFERRAHIMLKPELGGLEGTEEYIRVLGGLEGAALFFLNQRKAFGRHITKVFDSADVKVPTYSGFIGVPSIYQKIGSITSLKNHGFSLDGEISKEAGYGTRDYWAGKCFEEAGICLS